MNFFSDSLGLKLEQQKLKTETEYSNRCMAEQRILSLEQMLNLEEQKHEEISRKYSNEIENVTFCRCKIG